MVRTGITNVEYFNIQFSLKSHLCIGTKLCEEHQHKKSHIIRQPWTLQEARYDLATLIYVLDKF